MTPYNEGKEAAESWDAEPECPYEPGTAEYSSFADGFCDQLDDLRGRFL